MPLSTIFELYRGGKFDWWRKPEYAEKTTDLPEVTDKIVSHNVVSGTPRLRWGGEAGGGSNATLMSKNKDWLNRNKDDEWNDTSTCGLLFQ